MAAYAVDIMESAGVSMDAYVAAVLLGGVHVLSGMGASFAFSRYEYLCPSFSLLFFFSFSQFLITASTYLLLVMVSFILII